MNEARIAGFIIECPVWRTEVHIKGDDYHIAVETNANYDSDLEIQVSCKCGRIHTIMRRFH